MGVSLSVALQFTPEREHLLYRTAHLEPEIVTDPEPSTASHRVPWRTYRECLARTPEDSTHRLVLQDDAEPCGDFLSVLRRAIEARPESILALFVSGQMTHGARRIWEACNEDRAWAPLPQDTWIPVVALVWPRRQLDEFLEWSAQEKILRSHRADDAIVGDWCKQQRERVWATVPCLVEHPDDQPSSIGNRHPLPRRAVCFAGERAAMIDWSSGL